MHRFMRLMAASALTGCVAGLAGIALSYLLHGMQHLAFGYSTTHILSHESFLQGVEAAAPMRRFLVLLLCGAIVGGGWWALYRFATPLVSIKKALSLNYPRMPVKATGLHILLQIVTVGMGSPLGREVAPREAGAMLAGELAGRFGLSSKERQILVACGAGAGLAAVYNVPFAGALFTMEVLLAGFGWRIAAAAIISSVTASLVARIGLGNEHQYMVSGVAVTSSLECWSLLFGPLFGIAGWYYSEWARRARAAAPTDWRLPAGALLNFALIGILVIWFPQLPGNGKGAVSLSFDGDIDMHLAATLLILKVVCTLSSLRTGAQGGLLTPGLANGALMSILLATGWNLIWPGSSTGSYALVGATAFLAASQQMPVTAMILVLELTRVSPDFLVPMLLAVGGAMVAARSLANRRT